MKRRSFIFGAAASIFGERVANAAFGIFQTYIPSFNPVTVASEQHVFGMDPSDPTQYYVPGNGMPAVSTAAFYNMNGIYNFHPYDLDQMGAEGAAIKAAQGGRRYVWVASSDHPIFGYMWTGGEGFVAGYSFQPWDFPRTMSEILILANSTFSTPNHPGGGFQTYEFPTIFYNPDDPDGLPIYLMAEAGPAHYTALYRTADFVTFILKELSHFHSGGARWASFVRHPKRNGPGDFTNIALSTPGDSGIGICQSIWSSSDAIEYTSSFVPIAGMEGSPDSAGSTFSLGCTFEVGGQLYGIGRENATGGGLNQYCTIFPMNPTTYDKIDSPPKVRLASGWGNSGFPGPTFLQECAGYIEDGILYALPTYGFPSDVNTIALGAGRGGAPYANQGGLDHQFVDKLVVRIDDAAARLAAPVGILVSCAAGTVTITWKDALPQNTYRVYRGTNAATQATLIGDVTGTSTTDSPSEGRYWYKVVTLDNGTERQSRVLSVYVSSSSAFVNEHIDRVLDDGADISTINRAFLDRADAMLDSVGIRNVLEILTHPAAGIATTGAPGGFLKVYDPGTTRLPRSEDFKARTADTTYDSTGINGGPCWINANTNSWGYWGNLKRGNTIQKKRQITIVVAYERTQTTDDFTFVGTGPVFGTSFAGDAIIALKHTAGSPGSIEFSLSDETSTKTASVTASGSGLQIAIGTYDGTDMLAYTGSTAGSAVSTLDPNPEFGDGGTPGYVFGSLAGARDTDNNGTLAQNINVPGESFRMVFPLLGCGSVHNWVYRSATLADGVNFQEANAKGKIQCVMILEEALSPTQIDDVISFLTSAVDW